jgi:amino-acid N-acetyltransferase
MRPEIRIERATPADAEALLALMARADLPTEGLTAHLDAAFVARDGDRVVGSAAIEVYADGGLLRSVAVDADHRGSGLGNRLTGAAIDDARRRALPALYLLTTTAESYFPRFGFERISRDEVPASVRASVEFTGACPASATVMRLTCAHGANPASALFTKQLDILELDLVALAQAVPADRYDVRPSAGAFDGARTFGEQVRHVATMLYMTAAIVRQERSPYGPGTNDNGPDTVRTKAECLDYLAGALAHARKAAASLTEENLFDRLQTYFGSQTRAEVAAGLVYHSYNHYGQMVVAARMNGVVPPSSRRSGTAHGPRSAT